MQNEVYAVNTVAFHYIRHPIQVKVGEPVRIYLTNMTEFDLINSFHLHASMFRLYRTGTSLDQFELTDTVIMGQGERAVLEFTLENLENICSMPTKVNLPNWAGPVSLKRSV